MIVTDHQPHRVIVTVFGEFTMADYREFEDTVNYKVKFEGPVDLLFDLTQMASYTLDVVWEEMRFSRAHAHDFEHVAVITDSQWVTWSAWLSQIYVDTEMKIFTDRAEATAWLDDVSSV